MSFGCERNSMPCRFAKTARIAILLGLNLVLGDVAAVAQVPAAAVTEAVFAARSGPRSPTLFTERPAADTGILTENKYAPPRVGSGGVRDPRVWADRYHEFEVGAVGTGVAIGDYDSDGRPDLFVVSKTESCRLFRNLGDWKFADVTVAAGVQDGAESAAIWKQGASFVDVDNDGRLDLYVCRFAAPNLLYINQGDGTFKEEAAARGLAVNDASVMGAFCDYDRDGWLDVYVQTNLLSGTDHPNGQRDFLFHNRGNGTFEEVTVDAGIRGETQGHSATWWDFNEDGWPDLYVANDFGPADSLYRNNQDGTFTDVIHDVVPHQPYSSMGSDLGDVNNDGRIDFFVADMAATSHQKDQRGMANLRWQVQSGAELSSGAPQYARNALYLNTGMSRMLEIAPMAGLAATDWTWAVRFEDLDNDGRLDLFVTNGMHREVHNVDQLQRLMSAQSPADKLKIEQSSPKLIEANLAYQNQGDLAFKNVSAEWGLDEKGVSFGAAFGDFDGDGDLDLVYSNYQKGVTVLRNDSDAGHRVAFALRGTRSNRFGVGATIRIETATGVQVRTLVLARGVLSSSEPVVHFGLGADTDIIRATLSWPSGTTQVLENLAVDRRFTVMEPATKQGPTQKAVNRPAALFTEVGARLHLDLRAREATIDEVAQQPLLPFRQNRHGPHVAIGDLDGDGSDDVVLAGTTLDPARVIVRGSTTPLEGAAAQVNDGPVLVYDADGDGANDVLLTRGGASLAAGSVEYQPKLWLNEGSGKMRLATSDALPTWSSSVGGAAVGDFDHDARPDIFLGGRGLPGAYPACSPSAIWRNVGGRYEDVTSTFAPDLAQVGLVTGAAWSDLDRDGWVDLVLTLEWGGVRYWHNDQGQRLVDWSEQSGLTAAGAGLWSALAVADLNGDGRPDLILGNLGLNTTYQADAAHPAVMYVGDFKGDGSEQLIEGTYEGETLRPRRTRKELSREIPSLLKRYPKNDAYARATLAEIVGEGKLSSARRYAVTELRSGVLLSQSNGRYLFRVLPRMAQTAPVEAILVRDFDGDAIPDVYVAQNSYAPVPAVGRFDGGLSVLLRGKGDGTFVAVETAASGLLVPGDAKHLATLKLEGDTQESILVTRNNDSLLLFRPSRHVEKSAGVASNQKASTP